jgi:hypothetical protein
METPRAHYPGLPAHPSWHAGRGARMTNLARAHPSNSCPCPRLHPQRTLLTEILIVAEVALIAVLAPGFRYVFHQFFHF